MVHARCGCVGADHSGGCLEDDTVCNSAAPGGSAEHRHLAVRGGAPLRCGNGATIHAPEDSAMRGWNRWMAIAIVGLVVVASLFPIYWTIVASLSPEAGLFERPSLVPRHFVLEHYRMLFDERKFWVPIRNSLVVAGT